MQITIPDGWQQGRGAFGGLVVSHLLHAMQQDRPLRTVNATLCGPVLVGDATVTTETLRAGSGVTTMASRLVQNDEVQAYALAIYGKARVKDGTWCDKKPPHMKPWREVDVLPVGPPVAPVFSQHYEYRPTGTLPFGGATAREVTGWIKSKQPMARDAILLAMLADVYWPAAFIRFEMPRPIATISYMLQILDDDVPDAPLFHYGYADAARDGYTAEHRELWSEDGRLLAVNDQTIALIT